MIKELFTFTTIEKVVGNAQFLFLCFNEWRPETRVTRTREGRGDKMEKNIACSYPPIPKAARIIPGILTRANAFIVPIHRTPGTG